MNLETEFKLYLNEWIGIESTFDKDSIEPGKPFGENIYKALKWMENLAIADGFNVTNNAGYYITIDYGDNDEYIGVFGHCDVVSPGAGWNYSPFKLNEVENRWIGRGVIDDKGPVIASYLAMKRIKDSKIQLPYRLRLFVGGDEETGFRCIKEYIKSQKSPKLGFVVDAKFPVLNGERGCLKLKLVWSNDDIKGFVNVTGPLNVVVDSLEWFENNKSYEFKGKGGHASKRGLIDNPIKKFGQWANKFEWGNSLYDVLNYEDSITWISNLYCKGSCGSLSIEPTNLSIDKGRVEILYDVRFPENMNVEYLRTEVDKLFDKHSIRGNVDIEVLKEANYIDKDSDLVNNLLEVYKNYTGDNDSVVRITTGGTYASVLENTVIYGAEFPNSPAIGVHGKDESIEKEDLLLASQIYEAALLKLAYGNDKV